MTYFKVCIICTSTKKKETNASYQELKTSLQSEYPYNWKLVKEKDIPQEKQVDAHLHFFERVQQKTTSLQVIQAHCFSINANLDIQQVSKH